jgi:hypothetical protein
MKTLYNISIALILAQFTMQAQSGFPANLRDPLLDIITMKAEIDDNVGAYSMTGSIVITTPPTRTNGVAGALDASFYRNPVISRRGSNYIQVNAQATRLDNGRRNEFRIYVHRNSSSQGRVDTNKIKVNWKSPEHGEVDFIISNANVAYTNDSMLITGTHRKGNILLGMSFAIVKEVSVQ